MKIAFRTGIQVVAMLVGILGAAVSSPAAAAAARVQASPTPTDFVGEWQGTLAVGENRLRIIFHVRASSGGELESMMDSPDQGATGIPVASVTVTGESIALDIGVINAVYAGRLAESRQTIEGEWRQSGLVFPLSLERVEGATGFRRPQEPEPPYPYREEPVEIEVPGVGVTLAGTLTLPSGDHGPGRLIDDDARADRTVRVLPGLNHLFQPARTGLPKEYAPIEATIAPEVLELISDWIAERARADHHRP